MRSALTHHHGGSCLVKARHLMCQSLICFYVCLCWMASILKRAAYQVSWQGVMLVWLKCNNASVCNLQARLDDIFESGLHGCLRFNTLSMAIYMVLPAIWVCCQVLEVLLAVHVCDCCEHSRAELRRPVARWHTCISFMQAIRGALDFKVW